jgi:hypothetical protein
MPTDQSTETLTEAVGYFHETESFQAAIDELLTDGFDQSELSLLAGEHAIEAKLGHMYDKVTEIEDDPNAPRAAYVSKETFPEAEGLIFSGLFYVGAAVAAGAIVATGGAMLAALAGAAAGGGATGAIGAVIARMVGRHHANYIHEQLEKGGLLLWVRTRDEEHERRAVDILRKHSAQDVHTHPIPSAAAV